MILSFPILHALTMIMEELLMLNEQSQIYVKPYHIIDKAGQGFHTQHFAKHFQYICLEPGVS